MASFLLSLAPFRISKIRKSRHNNQVTIKQRLHTKYKSFKRLSIYAIHHEDWILDDNECSLSC
uniref:Uncharacterized protein n=1 Tax=Arundo donax TaxID=35708 RepID=A0A0A9CUE3_ARUDO